MTNTPFTQTPPHNNSNRRPSMAERRLSVTQEYNNNNTNNNNERRPSVVPQLAGLEKPLPEVIPDTVDVVIAGTGLSESILAAALAWQGSNVLHIDRNDYYGDTTATLTINQLKEWVQRVNKGDIQSYKDAVLYIPSGNELNSRDFGIDLTPKVLFAKSDLLSLLIKSRVYKYLEFLPLSSFHVFENDNFEKMNNTKQDIFTNQSLSLMTKRSLMKFIKFVLDWENQLEVWENFKKTSIEEFLTIQFKLEKPQIHELIFSIGLCNNPDIYTPEALARIKRYLVSFDVYGNFPVMYSKYGGAGEISQGFCRSAAVGGTTYKLNTRLTSFDSKTKIASFSDNSKIVVNEKIIISPTQAPINSNFKPEEEYEIQRLTVIVKKDCKEWFENGESASIVVFPSGSLKSNNKEAVQAVIMGEGTGITASETSVWYLSTISKGEQGRNDLESALQAMENSLLRESLGDELFEQNKELLYNNGVVNSVKLGQSFKDFVPKEKLQYLLKFYYVQFTSIPHHGIVIPSQYKNSIKSIQNSNEIDNEVVYTSLPSSEISYDGVITMAKILYETIVGSDDDFFDVDFEDEDEIETGDNLRHVDEDAIEDDPEPVEFAENMEL